MFLIFKPDRMLSGLGQYNRVKKHWRYSNDRKFLSKLRHAA